MTLTRWGRLIPPIGFSDSSPVGTPLTAFTVELNASIINTNTPGVTNLANVITSVMVHELGHSIGLNDNPTGAAVFNGSIMNSGTGADRDRNTLIAPKAYDITSVNSLYK